jgi:hypothetical protein
MTLFSSNDHFYHSILIHYWGQKTDRTVTNELPDGPYNFVHSGGLRYEAAQAYKCIRNGKF